MILIVPAEWPFNRSGRAPRMNDDSFILRFHVLRRDLLPVALRPMR
jgi:hypothetical protein